MICYSLRSIVCNYCCKETTENVVENLKLVLGGLAVIKWWLIFGNFSICCLLLGKHKPSKIEIEGFKLESVKSVELLRITIDYNLTFDTHIPNICRTASAKIKSLSRNGNVLDEKQAKLILALLFHISLTL